MDKFETFQLWGELENNNKPALYELSLLWKEKRHLAHVWIWRQIGIIWIWRLFAPFRSFWFLKFLKIGAKIKDSKKMAPKFTIWKLAPIFNFLKICPDIKYSKKKGAKI